ncbi:hypothetical protein ACSAGD_03770 [Paramicrobacterium sp. CJ85]|uniref:hypothetical protein n=1 Tax=Paramicrobacterium sp. CJ85 TaxID=3445355 RepID=UPI003F627156
MIESLQNSVASLPEALTWLGILVVAAIPLIESYFGSVIGVLLGLNPAVAIGMAVVGNIISMLIFVLSAHKVRQKVTSRAEPVEESPRRQKLRERFDRYGVAGVSLAGQALLPSQITSAAMVSFGASKNAVIFWQIISIILWGLAFGVLATLGVSFF